MDIGTIEINKVESYVKRKYGVVAKLIECSLEKYEDGTIFCMCRRW